MTIRYSKGVPEAEPIRLDELNQLIRKIRVLNITLVQLTGLGARDDWLDT
jgi:hypothetical protein